MKNLESLNDAKFQKLESEKIAEMSKIMGGNVYATTYKSTGACDTLDTSCTKTTFTDGTKGDIAPCK